MRLTMNQEDPAYDPVANHNAYVTLNGVECKMCIEADEEKGYVVRYIERERWPADWQAGPRDEWPTEKIEGAVKIKVKHGS